MGTGVIRGVGIGVNGGIGPGVGMIRGSGLNGGLHLLVRSLTQVLLLLSHLH